MKSFIVFIALFSTSYSFASSAENFERLSAAHDAQVTVDKALADNNISSGKISDLERGDGNIKIVYFAYTVITKTYMCRASESGLDRLEITCFAEEGGAPVDLNEIRDPSAKRAP